MESFTIHVFVRLHVCKHSKCVYKYVISAIKLCAFLCPRSQSTHGCPSPWGPSTRWGCGLPHHMATLSLACLQGCKVIGIALAASVPELSTFTAAGVIVEADHPGITGPVITRQGAHVTGGWSDRGWWVFLSKWRRK